MNVAWFSYIPTSKASKLFNIAYFIQKRNESELLTGIKPLVLKGEIRWTIFGIKISPAMNQSKHRFFLTFKLSCIDLEERGCWKNHLESRCGSGKGKWLALLCPILSKSGVLLKSWKLYFG